MSSIIEDLLKDIDPIMEENIKARMIIAAEIGDEIRSRGWSVKDFHKACNAVIPSDESNYGPRRIETWLSGTHDFKISELIVIKKVLGDGWIKRVDKILI